MADCASRDGTFAHLQVIDSSWPNTSRRKKQNDKQHTSDVNNKKPSLLLLCE